MLWWGNLLRCTTGSAPSWLLKRAMSTLFTTWKGRWETWIPLSLWARRYNSCASMGISLCALELVDRSFIWYTVYLLSTFWAPPECTLGLSYIFKLITMGFTYMHWCKNTIYLSVLLSCLTGLLYGILAGYISGSIKCTLGLCYWFKLIRI